MNNIKKLIKELEVEKSNAECNNKNADGNNRAMYELGLATAFDLCIHKLTLLLNTGNENNGKDCGE